MNNYGNQFNQGNLQPMQQPTYGYGQNAPYPAPMPTRKPADKNRVINIVMTALGGVTAFFALINLINYRIGTRRHRRHFRTSVTV